MTEEAAQLLKRAFAAYQQGQPVVVLSPGGNVLHGKEDLEAIRDLRIGLQVRIFRGIEEEFFNSDWPETLEAARQLFMRDAWPKS